MHFFLHFTFYSNGSLVYTTSPLDPLANSDIQADDQDLCTKTKCIASLAIT